MTLRTFAILFWESVLLFVISETSDQTDVQLFWNSLLGAFAKLRKSTLNFVVFCLSICPSLRVEQVGSSACIFVKFHMWDILENVSRKFNFH